MESRSPDTRNKDCGTCSRLLTPAATFVIDGKLLCLLCAARHRPLLRRSLKVSMIVGTILVTINQGPYLAAGQISPAMYWKIPLNYLVPFCVATWGALSNMRPPSPGM